MKTCIIGPLTRAGRCIHTSRSLQRNAFRNVSRLERQCRHFQGVVMASENVKEAPVEEAKAPSFEAKQSSLPRISPAEASRALVDRSEFGVLGNNAKKNEMEGFPNVSYVDYVADENGRPIFAFSTLSPRTPDINVDGRCTLMVMEERTLNIWNEKVAVTGTIKKLEGEEVEEAKKAYLARKPDAIHLGFGDVSLYRLDDLVSLYYTVNIGVGPARAKKVKPEAYFEAELDPVAKFSTPICKHMNEDHGDANVAIANHFSGLEFTTANMVRLDRLGADFICSNNQTKRIPFRLAFPRPAETRKAVREIIVELTKEISQES